MPDLAPKTLVIGGGLIGTAAAVELSERGMRVAVLSRSINSLTVEGIADITEGVGAVWAWETRDL